MTTSCPAKPYPEFPLYAHKSGRWAKKIRGKTHFFGPWREAHQALTRYLAEKDDLESGRQVRASVTPGDTLTVKKMVAAYLAAKKLSVECGDMTRRTLCEYKTYGTRMIKVFGANTPVEQLGPETFNDYVLTCKRPIRVYSPFRGMSRRSRSILVGPRGRATLTEFLGTVTRWRAHPERL